MLAQANIKSSLDDPLYVADMATLVATGADFITLNEVPFRTRAEITPEGYASWRTRRWSGDNRQKWGTAVLWRTDRWRSVRRGVLRVTRSRVELDNRWAHWVRLVPRDGSGPPVAVISTHLMTNPLRSQPEALDRRVARYRRGMVRLNRLVERLGRHSQVLLGGDLNAHYPRTGGRGDPWGPTAMLARVGARSTYDLLGQPQGGWATHDGGGTIDYVFFRPSTGPIPFSHRTVPLHSDHRMLVVRFRDEGAGRRVRRAG